MSDESLELDELEGGPRRKGGPMIVVAAIVAAAGGAFAGLQFLGPAVGTSLASEPSAETEAESGDGYGGESGDAAPQVHMIDNLVVNPAGSSNRFLIASIALAPGEGATAETLAARDVELRDVLLRLLGSKTVDQLSDIAQRDGLAQEMIDRLSAQLGDGVIRRVYLPQFVIQ